MSITSANNYVVVATKTRRWRILAGELESQDGDTVVLLNARMIVYYSSDCHGLLGVARDGPGKEGRVSPRVDKVEVRGVELILNTTKEAREAIETEPWG